MSAFKKIAGVIAGASAVAVIGAAVAQSVPPNPFVTNHAQGAGQQSTHLTWMGETGTPWPMQEQAVAQVVPIQEPAPVAQIEPAPEPAPQQQMGAAPAEPQVIEQPAPVARADRG